MTLSRSNPVSVEVLRAAPQVPLKKQIDQLVTDIRQVERDNQGWLRKQADLVKLRLGVRRPTNRPWPGAANVSIPLIDGVIRRWRPGIAALVLDAEPVAFFTAQSTADYDPARTVEPFFTYLFREAMETTIPTVQLVDLIAWRGHAYTREAWKYTTRRQARIIPVAHLFPQGVQQHIQTIVKAAEDAGQQPPTPEEIVQAQVAQEYALSPSDERDIPILAQASQRILEGAEFVKITYREVVEDRPDWMALDPIDVIVPQDQDPEQADFFCISHKMTPDQLMSMEIDGHLARGKTAELMKDDPEEPEGAGMVKSGESLRRTIRDLMDKRAGTTIHRSRSSEAAFHEIWEVYCHLDLDGSGERQRCLMWYAPNSDKELGVLDYPFPFKGWPITYFPFEGAPRPIDNRGLADMLRSYQKIVNAFHNARLNAASLTLSPVILQRRTAGNMKVRAKFRPGAIINVQDPGDVQIMQKAGEGLGILSGLLQEEQVNQRLAETYVGVFDAALTNVQQSKERRTAAEVQAITNLSGNIFGLDAKIFSTSLSRS